MKQMISILFILLLVGMLAFTFNIMPRKAVAEDTPSFDVLDEVGTYFELPRFNVYVATDSTVHIYLRACSSEMISYFIENASDASSTQITFGYLKPCTTYYLYEDSYVNETAFMTDDNGSYTYTQDLSTLHAVFIQPVHSTVYVNTDTTLQSDIYGDVVITASNIVLDLNGHNIIGTPQTWIGIDDSYTNNVIIENGGITNQYLGIYLGDTWSVTIRNMTLSWSYLDVEMSGVWNSLIVENTFAPSGYPLEIGWQSSGNTIYHNNFMDGNCRIAQGYPNVWDDGYPSGGNYWSSYTAADAYHGPNQDIPGGDGIGDSPYVFNADNIDHYPLMHPWGWHKLTVNTDPPGLVPAPSVNPTSPDGFYAAGTVVTLTANAVSGYTFSNWEVNPPVASQTQPNTVVLTMSQDHTATAHYTFNLNVTTGFKAGDSPSYASDPYLSDLLCVLTKATGGYKLAGTSPGTFDYAIAISNVGTTTFTSISLNINGHSDFSLHSENPIRVLDAGGSDITAQFAISGTWPTITISSTSTFTGLAASGSLYVTVHLDYALKGHIFSSSIYTMGYTFTATVSGTSGANQGTTQASGSVALLSKKVTVIFGFVTDRLGNPIEQAEVDLYKGTQLLYRGSTDADGFYCFVDGVDGVSLTGGVTYRISIINPLATYSQTVTAVSQTAVPVNFNGIRCPL